MEKLEDVKMIEYEKFAEMDLRVGQVLDAEKHPNADKLMILKVDLGEQNARKIVAGIMGKYQPEEMIGKQIIVVANLKPAKIRGVESQGMLLAAIDNETPILLKPSEEVKPGTKIG